MAKQNPDGEDLTVNQETVQNEQEGQEELKVLDAGGFPPELAEKLDRLEALQAENEAMKQRLALWGERNANAGSGGPRALLGMVKVGTKFIPVKRVLDTSETIDLFHREAYEKGFESAIREMEDGEDPRLFGWPKGTINITPDVPGAIAVPDEAAGAADDNESAGAWA